MPNKPKRKQPHRQEKKVRKAPAASASSSVQPPLKTIERVDAPAKVAMRQIQTPAAFSQTRHPYLTSELKNISILSVILLIILILLAVFLPGLLS